MERIFMGENLKFSLLVSLIALVGLGNSKVSARKDCITFDL